MVIIGDPCRIPLRGPQRGGFPQMDRRRFLMASGAAFSVAIFPRQAESSQLLQPLVFFVQGLQKIIRFTDEFLTAFAKVTGDVDSLIDLVDKYLNRPVPAEALMIFVNPSSSDFVFSSDYTRSSQIHKTTDKGELYSVAKKNTEAQASISLAVPSGYYDFIPVLPRTKLASNRCFATLVESDGLTDVALLETV